MPKQMTLAALLVAAVAGNIYLIVDGKTEQVAVVEELRPGAVEIQGALGDELLKVEAAKMDCMIEVDTHPQGDKTPRIRCTDHKQSERWLDAQASADLASAVGKSSGELVIKDGKAYFTPLDFVVTQEAGP